MLVPDDGYFFGIGAFETIAVENGTPVLLEAHYRRLYHALDFFKMEYSQTEIEHRVEKALEDPELCRGRKVLKVTVSPQNMMTSVRDNPYGDSAYEPGFHTEFSKVRKNETSEFTFHKTLNCGDGILEKRRARTHGIEEPIFINGKGEIAEGAVTNVFFVKNGNIVTPAVPCGLLPGTVREFLIREYGIEETVIRPEEIREYEEMFLTNALMWVMPVVSLGDFVFPSQETGRRLLEECRKRWSR